VEQLVRIRLNLGLQPQVDVTYHVLAGPSIAYSIERVHCAGQEMKVHTIKSIVMRAREGSLREILAGETRLLWYCQRLDGSVLVVQSRPCRYRLEEYTIRSSRVALRNQCIGQLPMV
jgi:hypothetical protein